MDARDRARGDAGNGDMELAPRRGLLGAWDRLVGPGASTVENVGTVGSALTGALLAPHLGRLEGEGARWAGARRGVVAVIAADL